MLGINSAKKAGDKLSIQKIEIGRDRQTQWMIVDLGGTYPIAKLVLDTDTMDYSTVEYSLDSHHWIEVKIEETDANVRSINFHHVLARYIKISHSMLEAKLDGRDIEIYAGIGLVVEPAPDWTELFHRKEGWSGADGIYSIPFNGCEKQGEADKTKTIFVFGDTFIGSVDRETNERLDFNMINNSIAILDGGKPQEDAIEFRWNTNEAGDPTSYFVPTTEKGVKIDQSYYWLQDGISISGIFYCFPLIISPDSTQPEGFEFKVNGVTCVSAPIGADGPILEQQQQLDTPFYFTADNGKITYFGAGFMANTKEAKVPNPDGYIYIYGLQKWETTKLVVARVLPDQFTEFSLWQVWDGENWTKDIGKATPIASEVSSELSVSPMLGGTLNGKYIVVFQEHSTGNRLGIYVGDSPLGPFETPQYVYYCSESERGDSVYTYNAKAHPHLSEPGELIVSYNVNSSSWKMHEKDGSMYRPRFLKISQLE
ncbi:DUF4185 domain-containing protein [Lederbergia graminis]|uniref:DUF4185 domain-containing protein n=1 Tax=Lederbergia graminis TaxID=735518 RepID=A0ABW0LG34_9BACI